MKQIKIIEKNKKQEKKEQEEEKKEQEKFIKDIETIIYEIQSNTINWNIKTITIQLRNNNINDINEYHIYINQNPQLNLPKDLFLDFPEFDFNETYLNSPYHSRNKCIEIIKKYKITVISNNKKTNKDILQFLVKLDPKIPNKCLWTYYGGEIKDFILFK